MLIECIIAFKDFLHFYIISPSQKLISCDSLKMLFFLQAFSVRPHDNLMAAAFLYDGDRLLIGESSMILLLII